MSIAVLACFSPVPWLRIIAKQTKDQNQESLSVTLVPWAQLLSAASLLLRTKGLDAEIAGEIFPGLPAKMANHVRRKAAEDRSVISGNLGNEISEADATEILPNNEINP